MIKSLCQTSNNSNFEFEFLDTLSEKSEVWDSFLPLNHHLKQQNISIYEKNASTQNIYTIVYKNKAIIGLIFSQKLSVSAKDINFSMVKLGGWDCLLKSVLSVNCDIKLLVCGNLYRNNFQGFYFTENQDSALVMDCLNEYILSQDDIGGVLIKDCSSSIAFDQFKTGSFKKLEDDFVMSLDLKPSWSSIDSYASELSKKYRKRLVKIKESSCLLNYKKLTISDLNIYKKDLYDLYLQVYQKQNIKLGKLLPDYFIEMQTSLPDVFKVMGVFEGDKLIAFSSHLEEREGRSEIHYIGIDYAQNEQYNLYFNLLYWGLETAIEAQKTSLDLGRFAQVAKASLGAKPIYMQNYIFLKKPIVKWGFSWAFNTFYNKLDKDISFRNPFSSGKSQTTIV